MNLVSLYGLQTSDQRLATRMHNYMSTGFEANRPPPPNHNNNSLCRFVRLAHIYFLPRFTYTISTLIYGYDAVLMNCIVNKTQ